MKFHYTASRPDGKVEEGAYEAASPLEVLSYLGTQGLRPISVREAGAAGAAKSPLALGQKVTVADKIFLTKYLALMLRVGTDLFKAIDILIADFHKAVVRKILVEIREALEKGQPFYSTFARYPKYFSQVFVNLIKAGEASGGLEKVLDELAVSLEKEKDLRGRVRAALIYPMILLTLSLVMLLFLVTFALPRISKVFEGGGFEPPLFSRVVFSVGGFLNAHVIVVLVLFFGCAVGGAFFFRSTAAGKRLFREILRRAPVVKRLVKKIAIQQFATTLSALMRAGLPIVDSLEITADTVSERRIQDAVRRVSREGISRGITIGDAFRREPAFPAVVTNLIAISERAGHLDEILRTLAEFYEKEIDAELKIVTAFLEPVLLLGIGGVVGLIALSIIVPIYQLVGQF